jgi:hypothetical protein
MDNTKDNKIVKTVAVGMLFRMYKKYHPFRE